MRKRVVKSLNNQLILGLAVAPRVEEHIFRAGVSKSPQGLHHLLSPGQTMPTFIPTNANNVGHCWPLLDVGWPNEPNISTQHLSAFHSNSINNNNTGSTTLLIGSEYVSPPPAYLFKKISQRLLLFGAPLIKFSNCLRETCKILVLLLSYSINE